MTEGLPGTGWQLDPQTRRQLRLDQARAHLVARRHAEAVVELEDLLDADPDHTEALWMLSAALLELGDLLTAREAQRAVLATGGDRPSVWALLASTTFECADLDEAEHAARRALEGSDGELALAHEVLGQVVARSQGVEAALPHAFAAHLRDPLSFPLPTRRDDTAIRALLPHALAALPDATRAVWASVPLRLEDFPGAEVLLASSPPLSPRVVALYDGVPPDPWAPGHHPDALVIYRGNLAAAPSNDAAVQMLFDALEVEAMDWLEPPS